ncbi:MAG: site-specific integrase [Alphaproteobacteria bacterium]|nr:site-specific integrase [Alphaproteobacteria bacterium]
MKKQAKTLTDTQIRTALIFLETTRHPERNKIIFLLSIHGFRAKEIAQVTWSMVLDPEGAVNEKIELHNNASKGKNGGRVIFISSRLKELLSKYREETKGKFGNYIVRSERSHKMSPASITNWFQNLYKELGYEGCSSHSGRRTFVTKAARNIVKAGGSLHDVQKLVGHKHLSTTQLYIDQDSDAQRKVIKMVCSF